MKMKDLSHIENRFARIAGRLTAAHCSGWKMARREIPLPENYEIVLRPDEMVIVRGYYREPDGSVNYLNAGLHFHDTIERLEKIAASRGLRPITGREWLEKASENQLDFRHGQDGDLEFLEIIAGPGACPEMMIEDDAAGTLISEVEVEGLITSLEKILPVLRAELGGDRPQEFHGDAFCRAAMIETLDTASNILADMAAVLDEKE